MFYILSFLNTFIFPCSNGLALFTILENILSVINVIPKFYQSKWTINHWQLVPFQFFQVIPESKNDNDDDDDDDDDNDSDGDDDSFDDGDNFDNVDDVDNDNDNDNNSNNINNESDDNSSNFESYDESEEPDSIASDEEF